MSGQKIGVIRGCARTIGSGDATCICGICTVAHHSIQPSQSFLPSAEKLRTTETPLERIRAKITELDAKLADLKIVERELLNLGPRTEPRPAAAAAKTPRVKRLPKAEPTAAPKQTIGGAIAQVLGEHGALAVAEIADRIAAAGRDINRRSVSFSLQAMKKQGLVKSADGKWALPKPRAKPMPA
jgi:hypothetical protein